MTLADIENDALRYLIEELREQCYCKRTGANAAYPCQPCRAVDLTVERLKAKKKALPVLQWSGPTGPG